VKIEQPGPGSRAPEKPKRIRSTSVPDQDSLLFVRIRILATTLRKIKKKPLISAVFLTS
jgi:hypothetical protein